MTYDPLIFGKSNIEGIVSCEVKGNEIDLFIQKQDGSIKIETKTHKYWLLTSIPISSESKRLEGKGYFAYLNRFEDKKEVFEAKRLVSKDASFSVSNDKEAAMLYYGFTYFKGLNPKEVSVLSFDIETTGLNPEAEDAQVILISTTFRSKNETIKKLFSYDEYESEGKMLEDFAKYVYELNPSIIVGHNIFVFDIPYLAKRAKICKISLNLGRDNSEPYINTKYESAMRIDGTRDLHYHKIHIYGREIIDTMFLAYKYDVARKYESYGLKKIIAQEGLEKKDRTFYDASLIRVNYTNPEEMQKIKAYCIDDSDDALALYDLMIPSMFYWTQSVPKPFQLIIESATGSQINSMMIRSYLQKGHSLPKPSELIGVQGGISFGIPGIYKNAWKVDIKSAYPSAILTHNLYDKVKDPDGNMFKICEYFTHKRFEYKAKYKETNDSYYQALDATAKICINSIYGFCAAPGLLFNSPIIAAKITQITRDWLNKAMVWGTGKDKDYWLNLNDELSTGEV